MKLYQILYFHEVCKSDCNITKASYSLNVSQPTISNSIKELEKRFDVKLFNRKKNRLEITKEGKYFFDLVSNLIDQSNEIIQRMNELKNIHHPLKVGITPGIGTFILPKVLKSFQKLFPNLGVEIFEHNDLDLLLSLIDDDVLDFGILISGGFDAEPFDTKHILSTKFVFCVNADSSISAPDYIPSGNLNDIPVVLFNDPRILDYLNEKGINPRVILRSSQVTTILKMIYDNSAGALLLKEHVPNDPKLKYFEIDPSEEVSIDLIWKKSKYLNSASQEFIEFFSQKLNF